MADEIERAATALREAVAGMQRRVVAAHVDPRAELTVAVLNNGEVWILKGEPLEWHQLGGPIPGCAGYEGAQLAKALVPRRSRPPKGGEGA